MAVRVTTYHYTWHTNRDTYDKIIFDDVRDLMLFLLAILTYLASEEEDELMPRDRRVLPINPLNWEKR